MVDYNFFRYIFPLFFLNDVVSTLDTTSGHLKLADFGNAARLSTSGSITKVKQILHFLPVKPSTGIQAWVRISKKAFLTFSTGTGTYSSWNLQRFFA